MVLPEMTLQMMAAASIAVAVLGTILGYIVGRRTSASGQKYREVERKLDQVLQEKKIYEDEVMEHFGETARLFNNLTDNYREVHNHLAAGAGELCRGEGPVGLAQLENERDPAEIPPHLAQVQPPLDYAPKSSPDEKGMLNEEFGIERKPAPGMEDQGPPRGS
ncbi:MAG: YhcB family protein [Halioglobus sp.]|nr:YhcB family protein [Halioglobus sp.]